MKKILNSGRKIIVGEHKSRLHTYKCIIDSTDLQREFFILPVLFLAFSQKPKYLLQVETWNSKLVLVFFTGGKAMGMGMRTGMGERSKIHSEANNTYIRSSSFYLSVPFYVSAWLVCNFDCLRKLTARYGVLSPSKQLLERFKPFKRWEWKKKKCKKRKGKEKKIKMKERTLLISHYL